MQRCHCSVKGNVTDNRMRAAAMAWQAGLTMEPVGAAQTVLVAGGGLWCRPAEGRPVIPGTASEGRYLLGYESSLAEDPELSDLLRFEDPKVAADDFGVALAEGFG